MQFAIMEIKLTGSRSIPWLVFGLAVAVLIVSLACVGAALFFVIGWWAPGLAVFVAVGVLALAVRTFPHHARFRSR